MSAAILVHTIETLPSHNVMLNNILARYAAATPAQIHDGEQWYTEARNYAVALAQTSGVPLETCAAVLAMTSLKTSWADNKQRAARVIAAHVRGVAIPSVHFGAVMRKIARVLAGGNPYDIVKGPKENPFFRAIMGDLDACVIDRWAYLTATGSRIGENGSITVAVSRLIQAAFREAADILKIPVAILQAIVWVIERGSAV